jgi:uncharacterized membrane protein YidH (DUF202 family)
MSYKYRATSGAGVALVLVLIVLLLLLTPILTLWSLNTLSEQGSLGWYIPHNVWTYLAIYALVVVFRGGSK